MTKKKRTVITEESHEVWIIRQGERESHDASSDTGSGSIVSTEDSLMDSLSANALEIPVDCNTEEVAPPRPSNKRSNHEDNQ